MTEKSKTDPKARSITPDTLTRAGDKDDTQLSDAALDKVVGGDARVSGELENVAKSNTSTI